jgi:hypothetical protein
MLSCFVLGLRRFKRCAPFKLSPDSRGSLCAQISPLTTKNSVLAPRRQERKRNLPYPTPNLASFALLRLLRTGFCASHNRVVRERPLTSFEMTDRLLCCHSEPFGKAQDKLREESFPAVRLQECQTAPLPIIAIRGLCDR